MNAIEIKGLCKTYADFSIDHLDLTLPGGYIMGLIGENGAGKSTTIKLILNMAKKDSGTVTVLGRDNGDNFALTKNDIGVVLDEVGIPGCLNTKKIEKIMKNTYKNWDSDKFNSLISSLKVPTDKPFKNFSKGMKMKLGIAIALSHNAKLLLLDEATSGLDPVVRDEVTTLLSEFTRDENHSVLISSHIVSDLEKICDYIAFLHNGKLLLCEEKDRLKERYGVFHGTALEILSLPTDAVISKKTNDYGGEALVVRDKMPEGAAMSPVDIEQLFVCMVKGDK